MRAPKGEGELTLQVSEMSVEIRPARPDDAEALAEVERAAFDPKLYSSIWKARDFRRAMARSQIVLVAMLDGAVRGYALGLTRSNSRLVRFYSLAAHPEAKGRRLGEYLFTALELESRERGYAGVILEIRKDNRFLLERYGSYGYRPYREVPNYYPDGCSCIKMKRLFRADEHGAEPAAPEERVSRNL